MARVLADKLGQLWRQTVIVENKPGIAGTVTPPTTLRTVIH